MAHPDFLIIGGGIIGMLTAKHLDDAGASVTLLERDRCGLEASWAGGGIVSPLYPWQQPNTISELAVASQAFYPDLAAELLDTTGIDCEYRRHGLLYLAPDDISLAQGWARRFNQQLDRLEAAHVARIAPKLGFPADEALWMPQLGSIRNPRLCRALRDHLRQRKRVRLYEDTTVHRLRRDTHGTIEAVTSKNTFAADRTIVCGGAWSASLFASIGVDLPITPVKGQMLLFDARSHTDAPLLDRVVLRQGRYLIPREDGRILVGSTLEPEAHFDKTVSSRAAASLRHSATALLPALAECPVEHHWAGLRPAAPSGVPFIGQVPGADNLFVNAGHYRNGIVLAPATTRLLVDQLLGQAPALDPSPYWPSLDRSLSPA